MDYNNLKSNSFASKVVTDEDKDVNIKHVSKPVTKGTIKKKNKLFSGLVSDDAGMVKDYIVGDVVLPAIKKVIDDIITNGIHILLYGNASVGHKDYSRYSSPVTYISYDRFADRKDSYSYRRDNAFDPDYIEVATRAEAEEVLDNLGAIIGQFGFARMSELYELVGITAPYTGNRYGWDTLKGARIERTYKGSYLIIMPKAILLN